MFSFCNAAILANAFSILMTVAAHALECPPMPEQTRKDWEVEVKTAIGKIGPARGAELEARTKAVTKDLMGKLPQADRVYLEQMMLATYCSALRDDKNISETDKGNRIKAYNSEVRKTLYGQQGKPQASSSSEKGRQQTPSPQSKQQRPKQNEESKHRWNAWRPNRAIVEKLREPVNEHTNADIIFFDPVHRFFGERLASALESAGWRVNFTKTAQGSRNPHHYEGVEVKGVNRYLVESVVSVLKESGINGVKSQIELTQLNPNDADYQNVRNRINL